MMTTMNIIRQKANYEKMCDIKTNGHLYCPREDYNGIIYVTSDTGEIFSFSEGTSEQQYILHNGMPIGICFDQSTLYIADQNIGGIYFKNHLNENNPTIENIMIKEFEELPLKGPTSLAFNKADNLLYMTDVGNFLNSSLYPKNGSLFVIDLDSRIIRPILLNSLSYPSDILYDSIRGHLYIADTFSNRVLRLIQNPEGVYHPSVFVQFNGRIGPSALAQDELGNIYVARYESSYGPQDYDGLISVLNTDGNLIGEIFLPKLPEITGMFISFKKKENLYLTEKSTNGVLKIKLTHFISELDKAKPDDNLKFT